jgi:dynein heavy chain
VTTSTIEVYNTIAREMRPTPSKSHYTFNLRDLAKVFQGILSCDARSMTSGAISVSAGGRVGNHQH